MTLVSICIPIYNGERYLKECLEAVKNQTHRELEVIIVDDQSQDRSSEIISSFIEKDKRFKFHRNGENMGLVRNWNQCIKLASGDWIKFHFQDDLMARDCVEKMLRSAEKGEARLVICDRNYVFEEDSRRKFYNQTLPRLNHYFLDSTLINEREMAVICMQNFLGYNFLGEPIAGLINRKLFNDYGYFDERLGQICDFEFWLRIGLNEPVFFIHEPLVTFRIHHESTTNKNAVSFNNEIPVSVNDRLVLGEMIMKTEHYRAFRKYAKSKGFSIKKSFRQKVSEYVIDYGLGQMSNWLGWGFVYNNIRITPLNLLRMIKHRLLSK